MAAGRCLWIADAIRDFGVRVVEVDGWRTRGAATMNPRGVVGHHDAFRSTISSDAAVRLMVNGRSDLPGPLCQVWLDDDADDTAAKGDPVAFVIASGRAHHAGRGGFRGLTGNSSVLGIEARNNGLGDVWTDPMQDAYHRVAAALLDGAGRDESWFCGHKEWTSRKPDPAGLDMGDFRTAIGAVLADPHPTPPTPISPTFLEEDDMRIIKAPNDNHARIEGGTFMEYPVSTNEEIGNLWTDALWLLGEGRKVQLVSYDQWNYEKQTRARVRRGENSAIVRSE